MTCFVFNNIVIKMNGRNCRHCEERSDEASYTKEKSLWKTVCLEEKWIASHGRCPLLAMTNVCHAEFKASRKLLDFSIYLADSETSSE